MVVARIARFSPNSCSPESSEGLVAADERDIFDETLRRQHAIEWIAMLAE